MIRTFHHLGSDYTVKDGGGYVRALHTGRVIRDPFSNKMIRAAGADEALASVEAAWRGAAVLDILAAKRLWPPDRGRTSVLAKWARRRAIRRCTRLDTRALLEERTVAVDSRTIETRTPSHHLAAVQGGAHRLPRPAKSWAPDLSPAR